MIKKNQKGFTLIELLIVVAIIGILAAIAIPNLLTAMQRAKQKRSMADMRTIATDVNKYTAAGAFLPSNTVAQGTMDTMLAPTYMKALVKNDGWGNSFIYATDALGQTYSISSYGRDGAKGTDPTVTTTTTNFDCDIIYSQGQFLQYPEGVQQQ